MLEKGVAATVGPVYEPYVQGFPLPELFFSRLAEGYMSLGESYLVSLPYLSWQIILIVIRSINLLRQNQSERKQGRKNQCSSTLPGAVGQ